MKSLLCLFAFLFILSCDSDEDRVLLRVAVPEVMSKAELRSAVDIRAPQPIAETGKIYAYNNYLFIGDKNRGVHVVDNSNPESPSFLSFLKIPLNEDVAVKDNILYADSGTDLLVFDISNINAIELQGRVEEMFDVYNLQFPDDDYDWTDYESIDYENDIVVGWNFEQRIYDKDDDPRLRYLEFDGVSNGALGSNSGTGGSLARFQIVKNRLYTVGISKMNIFNIDNLTQPTLVTSEQVGWNIETMFYADDYLYLGSSNGMFIYSIENSDAPTYVSEFWHWNGCDPVVVEGDYAYLTIRGGNLCGLDESVLEIIDVSDKSNPTLKRRVTLENPYGLGVKDDVLFICDGNAGLKVFDRSDPEFPVLTETIDDVVAYDVIPLNSALLMIGDQILNQYQYTSNGSIRLLSSLSLN